MKIRSIWTLPAVGCMMLFMASCSGSSHTDEVIAEESIYDPGAPVSAVGFGEACGIRLFLQDENGGLSPPERWRLCGTRKQEVRGGNCVRPLVDRPGACF
ncbi:MAG: hypothetical protein ACOX3E_00105 [Desulfomonilia bacterium]